MKKIFILSILFAVTFTSIYAETYEVRRNPGSEEYFVDRKIREAKENRLNNPNSYAGVITRFGYGFNYDAFTYGVSFFYQWSRIAGITAGFDGYYIPNKLAYRTIQTDIVSTSAFSLPLWDIRAGFMITRYFLFGAMLGKSNIGDATNLINMREAWFAPNKESNFLFGGFVTFVLPISKHFGFNLDFAVTNKTGFNVGAGINVTIPVK